MCEPSTTAYLDAMVVSLLATLALTRFIAPQAAPALEHVATLPTAAPGAEIFSVQASSARAVLTHSKTGQLELFELSDPARPQSVRVIDLAPAKGEELTSVAFHPSADWCLAVVQASGRAAPGRALVLSAADGSVLGTFP